MLIKSCLLKQMALHLDCNSAIVKKHGKYAGPLAELEVSEKKGLEKLF